MASTVPIDTRFSAIVARLLKSLGSDLDTTPGSVVRTLTEAYAREMATFYAMLEQAHRSGYLATAEGEALDNVVELLGLRRARAGRLVGKVEFRRSTPAPEDIGIPSGRQVTGVLQGAVPLPLFETQEDAVLPRGEMRVEVPVQQVSQDESDEEEVSVINPGQLTVLPRPVMGVEMVTNLNPLLRQGEDETDESLRARASTALRDTAKGTLEAIQAAVVEQGVRQLTVREPPAGPPGVVEVLISDAGFDEDPRAVERVEQAVRLVKPAGIRVRLQYTRTVYVQPEFSVEPVDPELDAAGFVRLRTQLQESIAAFIRGLAVGESVTRRKLEGVLFANPGVRHVSELRMVTFVRQSDGKGGFVLVREEGSREYGAARDWNIRDQEKAALDPRGKPPQISRLRPLVYRLDLVVARSANDRRSPDAVRQAILAALEDYAVVLFGQDAPVIAWSSLETELKRQAEVARLLSVVITTDSGAAVTLSSAQDSYATQKSPRLTLRSVEMVQA